MMKAKAFFKVIEMTLPYAKDIIEMLKQRSNKEKLKAAIELFEGGASAYEALDKTFGNSFHSILKQAEANNEFVYESVTKDIYIEEDLGKGKTDIEKVELLREELNKNLNKFYGSTPVKNDASIINALSGIVRIWSDRYRETFSDITKEEEELLVIVSKMLNSKPNNYRDLFVVLVKSGMGVGGALMIIGGALLYINVGQGLVASLWASIVGASIPFLNIALLIIFGAVFIVIAFIPINKKSLLNFCRYSLYTMLDKRKKIIKNDESILPPHYKNRKRIKAVISEVVQEYLK